MMAVYETCLAMMSATLQYPHFNISLDHLGNIRDVNFGLCTSTSLEHGRSSYTLKSLDLTGAWRIDHLGRIEIEAVWEVEETKYKIEVINKSWWRRVYEPKVVKTLMNYRGWRPEGAFAFFQDPPPPPSPAEFSCRPSKLK